MAGVNVKMGVTGVSAFKQGMKDSESAVKALTSALKLNEKQLQAGGDKELYMSNQVAILTDAIAAQQKVVDEASRALEAMKNSGVKETSKAFNDMKKKVYDSTATLLDLRGELKSVEDQSGKTSTELEGIGKNVAWDNVAEGIGKITDRMQSAARAAVNLGKKIAKSVMSSADWADDLKTEAAKWDISVEDLQKMEKVADIIDTDVDAILTAQSKMKKSATTKGGIQAIEQTLGLSLDGQNADDLFWEIGDALLHMGDEFDKEAAAQTVFGKSWRDLLPLFKAGREEYEALLEAQSYVTEEDVNKLGELDDTIESIKNNIEQMKNQFIADNAEKIMGLLQWLIDNADAVKAGLITIGAGFGTLKLAEAAANVAKIVSGLKTLGLIKGGSAAATATGAAGGASVGALGLTAGVAMFPAAAAYVASQAIPDEYKLGKEERIVSSTYSQEELQNLRQWVELQNELYHIESKYGTTDFNEDRYIELHQMLSGMDVQSSDLWRKYWEYLVANDITPGTKELPTDFLDQMIEESLGGTPEIHAEPVLTDNAGQVLQQQLDGMSFRVPVIPSFGGDGTPHANGLPWVPYDGYPAFLHKGERVLTARENRSYSANSNLYVEHMDMHNGMDAQALAAALSAQNRRAAAGFGQ